MLELSPRKSRCGEYPTLDSILGTLFRVWLYPLSGNDNWLSAANHQEWLNRLAFLASCVGHYRMSDLRDGPWTMTILMGIAGVCLISLGLLLGLFYCEYRRGNDLQVTYAALAIGQRCTETLGEVVPGALILARTPQRIAISPAARDSLRVHRWTTP